jgi:hypothetical protein
VADRQSQSYFELMQARTKHFLAWILAAVVAIAALDIASAKPKRKRAEPSDLPPITRDVDGTPIIMQGFRRTRPPSASENPPPQQNAERPVRVPRGSSTYIPPPMPSPTAGPPAPALVQPPPAPYQPPPINTFSDRVRNCIHSAPLNAGVGNNPSDPQAYIRQCAN